MPGPATAGGPRHGGDVGAVLDAVLSPALGRTEGGPRRWALVGVPGLSAVVALTLLVPWGTWQASGMTHWFAAATLCAVGLRILMTYREVWSLAQARVEARTDQLTNLPNRRGFVARVDEVLDAARPPSADDDGESAPRAAVLLLDLDQFKEVNDSLGHGAGDQLLVDLGRRLLGACRTSAGDVLARLGGDEFALLLPGADTDAAVAVAARIPGVLAEPFDVEGVRLHAAVSIGISVAPRDGSDASALLQRADIAMYRAKSARTGHAVFEPGLRGSDGTDRLQRLADLRRGLDAGEFTVFYQPKISLAGDEVHGVEALVRWVHPAHGVLAPAAFLPLADSAGLLPRITEVVLRESLRHLSAWRAAGLELSVAVNLPTAAVVDAALPVRVQALLAEHGVPAEALTLEITEESLLDDRVRARVVLAQLRTMGVAVAIDDYGTGYSSLAYLRELPVDELKLDRSFVTPMAEDARAAAIVRSTVDLAHSLGLRIVAEGVEHARAVEQLTDYGCDAAQGYHYSRPVPAEELLSWLASRSASPADQSDQDAQQDPTARAARTARTAGSGTPRG